MHTWEVNEAASQQLRATGAPPQTPEFNAFLPRGMRTDFALKKAGNLINPRRLSASGTVLRSLSSVALPPGRPSGSVPPNGNGGAFGAAMDSKYVLDSGSALIDGYTQASLLPPGAVGTNVPPQGAPPKPSRRLRQHGASTSGTCRPSGGCSAVQTARICTDLARTAPNCTGGWRVRFPLALPGFQQLTGAAPLRAAQETPRTSPCAAT
jgi:hypothetical protein